MVVDVVLVVVVVALVVTVKQQLTVANRWITSTTWVAKQARGCSMKHEQVSSEASCSVALMQE